MSPIGSEDIGERAMSVATLLTAISIAIISRGSGTTPPIPVSVCNSGPQWSVIIHVGLVVDLQFSIRQSVIGREREMKSRATVATKLSLLGRNNVISGVCASRLFARSLQLLFGVGFAQCRSEISCA